MKVIRVATDDGNAYYTILTRLKKTNLPFVGISPSEVEGAEDEPVITTRRESKGIRALLSFAIEDLSENPLVMEGQILSRLIEPAKRKLVVGVDPGLRIGVAVIYGDKELGTLTVNSIESLLDLLSAVSGGVPHSSLLIRIGDGNPKFSLQLAARLQEALPLASLEMVDETGTSANTGHGPSKARTTTLTRDQLAAARIALRKGTLINGVRSQKNP